MQPNQFEGVAPYTENHLYAPVQPPDPQIEWNSGLFGCCDAPCNIQCLACCCPCYLYGAIATSPPLYDKDENPQAPCKCSGIAPRACGYCLLDHVLYSVMLAMSNQLVYCPFLTLPLSCIIHCGMRKKIRNLHGPGYELKGSCCSDVFLTFCCACCALVQEHQQLKDIAVAV